jgi:hypothetical protein
MTTDAAANFVDLTSNQLVAGSKAFSSNIWVNGISIGKKWFSKSIYWKL